MTTAPQNPRCDSGECRHLLSAHDDSGCTVLVRPSMLCGCLRTRPAAPVAQEPPSPAEWSPPRSAPEFDWNESSLGAQEPTDPPQGQPYLINLGSALVACSQCGAAVGTGHTVTHDAWHRSQS